MQGGEWAVEDVVDFLTDLSLGAHTSRSCVSLFPSSGVDLIFDTKLPEMGDLALAVIRLLCQLIVFSCEIRFLIRLGCF